MMNWPGHVACMGEMINVYQQKPLKASSHLEDEGVDGWHLKATEWIRVAQNSG
jgi:hypothetical protein